MWPLIYEITLFDVVKMTHGLMYNADNLQLLLLQ